MRGERKGQGQSVAPRPFDKNKTVRIVDVVKERGFEDFVEKGKDGIFKQNIKFVHPKTVDGKKTRQTGQSERSDAEKGLVEISVKADKGEIKRDKSKFLMVICDDITMQIQEGGCFQTRGGSRDESGGAKGDGIELDEQRL